MKKFRLIAAVLLVLVLLASCTTTFKTTNGKLAYAQLNGASKGSVEASGRAWYVIHPSLLGIQESNEKIDTIIEPALAAKGANAASNVEVKYGYTFVELLVSGLLGGLIQFPHVQVTGTAIAQ